MCLSGPPALHNIFHTPMARYSLFVLKVPLDCNQPEGMMSGSRACGRPKINCMNNVMSWTGLTIEGAVREEKVGERLSVMRHRRIEDD